MALERLETSGHLGAVGLEPLVEFSQGFGAQAVQTTLRVATDLDEARVAQHLEVPRHAGLMDANGINELRYRTLSAPYGIEDPSASRLGDHVKDSKIAGHGLNIRGHIYTRKQILHIRRTFGRRRENNSERPDRPVSHARSTAVDAARSSGLAALFELAVDRTSDPGRH